MFVALCKRVDHYANSLHIKILVASIIEALVLLSSSYAVTIEYEMQKENGPFCIIRWEICTHCTVVEGLAIRVVEFSKKLERFLPKNQYTHKEIFEF